MFGRRTNLASLTVVVLLFLTLTGYPAAQETPFLSDDEIRLLINEISGDRSFEHIRALTRWHRTSGSEGYFKAVDYILKAARDAGLEDVKFIEQPLNRRSYNAKSAELWMVEPVEVKLADIGDHALYLSDGSHDTDVTAELVWIGDGSESALEGIDVEGKIVLTSAYPGAAVTNAVWGMGAVGVVCYPTSEGKSPMDFPDQVAWTRIPGTPPEGEEGTFSFALSPRKGETLRRILETSGMQDFFATGKRTEGGRVVLRAKVDTEFGSDVSKTGFVEGWIRGARHNDQQIIITAHLQEEQGSANDDGSGCGNILETARVLNKLIAEGKIPRPLRDIRFWWTDEIYSEYRYFADYPEEVPRMMVNLHQDMVGARQSVGSRIQHLIYAPHSITSYLDTLLESVGEFVIQTNTSFLAASRAGGLPRPHTRGIYSARGSREGYGAAFVPYFGQSDYMSFVDGIIGVPAVALINWDDFYIHSTDDDLWQIDQTQLARNAFIITSMAYVLGKATPEDTYLFANETFAAGKRRLAEDLTKALRLILDGSTGENDGWGDANIIVEQGIQRELRAMNSVRDIAREHERSNEIISNLAALLDGVKSGMLKEISASYFNLHHKLPGQLTLTEVEAAAAQKVPANIENLDDYFRLRRDVRFSGALRGLMRFEVRNFIDGKRSYHGIYKAARAEALVIGEWYYGTVELGDVVSYLDALVDTGAVYLKGEGGS